MTLTAQLVPEVRDLLGRVYGCWGLTAPRFSDGQIGLALLEAKGTCKQGETAAKTGCVPASSEKKSGESPDKDAPAKADKEPEDDKKEWDGEIDQHAVEPSRRGDSEHIRDWNYHDSGENYEQNVFLRSGEYETPNGDTVDVYRWENRQNGDLIEQGKWTTDREKAWADGESHAEDNHEEPPEKEPEDDEDDDSEIRVDPDDIDEPDEPPPPPKKAKAPDTKLGKSAAKVEAAATVDKATLDKVSANLFGEEGIADVASVVGAPDDATVRVTYAGPYKTKYSDDVNISGATGVRVEIDHPKLDKVSRFIGVDSEGRKFIKNEILEIKRQFQGEGLGATIFAKQVENAAEEGFDYISTHAAGGPGERFNGYYTWPRFGYDESVKSIAKHNNPLAAKILEAYPQARSVREIMATEQGRTWWKENGGDLYNATFDVREGSWSRHILDEYLAKKRERKVA